VESDSREATAAGQRQAAMVEELGKATLVRHRLEDFQRLVGTYPEGHDTRVLLERTSKHLDRALGALRGYYREEAPFYGRGDACAIGPCIRTTENTPSRYFGE
jgi:hypothetical protein